jgi:hypothetical protein
MIVRVSKHWSGKTYNVDLLSPNGRKGDYMVVGKAFDVPIGVAQAEAQRVANLYGATIEELEL